MNTLHFSAVPPTTTPSTPSSLEQERIRFEERRIRDWTASLHALASREGASRTVEMLGQLGSRKELHRLFDELPRSRQPLSHEIHYLYARIAFDLARLPRIHCYWDILLRQVLFGAIYAPSLARSIDLQYNVFYGVRDYPHQLPAAIEERLQRFLATLSTPMATYRLDPDGHHDIQLPRAVLARLPRRFLTSTARFIEALPLLDRCIYPWMTPEEVQRMRPTVCNLADGYDWSRVKVFQDLVFKRVDVSRVADGLDEIEEAREVDELLAPSRRLRAQQFLGHVFANGNLYLVSRLVPHCANLFDLGGDPAVVDSFRQLIGDRHPDLEPRNIVVEFEGPERSRIVAYWLIDFEKRIPVNQLARAA